jgi:hypothetical protein
MIICASRDISVYILANKKGSILDSIGLYPTHKSRFRDSELAKLATEPCSLHQQKFCGVLFRLHFIRLNLLLCN